jgi:hypothetical protein
MQARKIFQVLQSEILGLVETVNNRDKVSSVKKKKNTRAKNDKPFG